MIKDGNAITTNLVSTLDTDEKSGVAITIEGIYDFKSYEDALKYIVFFPNVYLDIKNKNTCIKYNRTIETFNNIKIKKFKYYAAATIDLNTKILLGNVLYPLDYNVLDTENIRFYDDIKYTGLVIRFNIGELDITPNREGIIYSARCKEIINKRFKEAKKEIADHIKTSILTDYDNIFTYYEAKSRRFDYDPITGEVSIFGYRNFMFYPEQFHIRITYKGKDLSKAYSIIPFFNNVFLPSFKGAIEDDKIRTAIKNTNGRKFCSLTSNSIVLLKGTSRMTSVIREYLLDNYINTAVVGEFTKDDVILALVSHKVITLNDYKNNAEIKYIVDELYDRIISHIKILDVNTDEDFLEFKDEFSKSNSKTSNLKQLHLWVLNNSTGFLVERTYNNLEEVIQAIKRISGPIYICPYSEEIGKHHNVVKNFRNVTIIKCANTLFNKLIPIKFTNRVDIYDLVLNDGILRKIKTLDDYNYLFNIRSHDVLETIPEPLRSQIKDLILFYKAYNYQKPNTCRDLSELNIPSDPYTEELCKKYEEYRKIYDSVRDEYMVEGVFLFTVIKKLKSYRISYNAYQEIKSNKLLQLLCKS